MFGGGTCCFNFGTKVRTLEPVRAEVDCSQFFVGTRTLNQPNKIYLVQVNDRASAIVTRQVFNHPGEILSLAPSPHDRQLLVTCGKQRSQQTEASLWKLPEVEKDIENLEEEENAVLPQELEQLAAFPAQKLPVSEYEQIWRDCVVSS